MSPVAVATGLMPSPKVRVLGVIPSVINPPAVSIIWASEGSNVPLPFRSIQPTKVASVSTTVSVGAVMFRLSITPKSLSSSLPRPRSLIVMELLLVRKA